MRKGVLAVTAVILTLSFGIGLAEESDRRAVGAKHRYKRVIREIEIQRKKHEDLRKQEKSLLDHLDRLAFMRNRKNMELKSLQRQRLEIEKAIRLREKEMRGLTEGISLTRKRIEARVVALYKMSKLGPWAFLLSAENYGDFLRMFAFLNSMIGHDFRLLTTFDTQLARKEALQRRLAANWEDLANKQVAVSRKKREIEALQQQEKKSLRRLRAEKSSYAALIRDLEVQAEKLQVLVKRLSKERGDGLEEGSGFGALKGRLPVPVAGKIDRKKQGWFRGISLKAHRGAVVRAVYKGRVVYAGWFKGYGNLLIIDHGNKYHTVMGHASELLKEKGDWVEAGEPVARVGSTGSLGGSSLYFEIRRGGIPVNPLGWFSPKDRLALK
ncbi:MAG: peptidoglycan DD-metalloendopeptidase family protein [Deltaproteobacteria bacterium]|nr:peptidoglycan DD-metalloendopeptidase family protein [Deltaproteobacteria bacterium]